MSYHEDSEVKHYHVILWHAAHKCLFHIFTSGLRVYVTLGRTATLPYNIDFLSLLSRQLHWIELKGLGFRSLLSRELQERHQEPYAPLLLQ
jgi:hypothetical protein